MVQTRETKTKGGVLHVRRRGKRADPKKLAAARAAAAAAAVVPAEAAHVEIIKFVVNDIKDNAPSDKAGALDVLLNLAAWMYMMRGTLFDAAAMEMLMERISSRDADAVGRSVARCKEQGCQKSLTRNGRTRGVVHATLYCIVAMAAVALQMTTTVGIEGLINSLSCGGTLARMRASKCAPGFATMADFAGAYTMAVQRELPTLSGVVGALEQSLDGGNFDRTFTGYNSNNF